MIQQELVTRPDLKKERRAETDKLMQAIALVYFDFESRKLEPGAEKWQSDTRRWRRRLLDAIFEQWSTLTGDDEIFPWHDDYVADLWVAFRKQTSNVKMQWRDYYGIA